MQVNLYISVKSQIKSLIYHNKSFVLVNVATLSRLDEGGLCILCLFPFRAPVSNDFNKIIC